MIINYEPPSVEIIDNDFVEDISSVLAAIIEAETAISDSLPSSDKALNILSKQVERKQIKVKKLEVIVEKTKTLNSLHRNTLVYLEELHSQIKKRVDEADNIINYLNKISAVKGDGSSLGMR
jgi:archaellum component FlaC